MPLSDGLEPADETLVVIAWYDGDRLVALGDNDNGEPNLYLYGDPEVRELVEAATEAYGPTARAIPVKEFRKLAGEEALEEFPLLARHRGTPDYEPLLFLAETLIDGYMADEIDMDLEEMPDDPDELTGWLEHMNRAGWMEDEHGHAVHVTPMYVRYEDEGE